MSTRQKKFQEDVINAIELCKKYSWPFDNFEESETSIAFTIQKDDTKHPFSICITDDYPEYTIITRPDLPSHSQVSHKTVPVIFQSIHRELFTDGNGDKGLTLQVPLASRSISVESTDSNYVDCRSMNSNDDEEEDMEDYYNEEEDMEEDIDINTVLATDMEKLTSCHGDNTLSHRLLDTIDEIDIEISLQLSSFLEKEIAEAWKLNQEEPLVVRLHLSMTSYLDTPLPPRVEAFQPSKKDCGVASQLKKILETFVQQQWPKISNVKVQQLHDQQKMATQSNAAKFQELSKCITVNDKDLARLMDMGFATEMARNALILNHGNLEKAIDDLMTNSEGDGGDIKFSVDDNISPKKRHPGTFRQQSHPPVVKKIKKSFIRQKSSMASASASSSKACKTSPPSSDDLNLIPSSTLFIKNPKQVPDLKNGFLVQVYDYLRQRLPKLNEYCVVCDEPHVFANGAMLKPAVCSRELCVFAFQTLGVMADAAEDIATGAEVVDLLVAMTRAACSSNRKKIIFDPYPTVVDPANPKELSINPKNKDYDYVQKIIDCIPPVQEMTRLGGANIKRSLDEKDLVAFPLLQWIITSNRSHIVKLPLQRQISFMRTPHQFLLLSSPPAKEAIFRQEKAKFGSTFAFHGSGIENWHSIIREGLIVASGTNKQLNGAAYGKGIYLSPCACVSFGYSRMGYSSHTKKQSNKSESKSRFLSSKNISCIAICEVITSPDLKKSGTIWVCPNPDHVCTRFFFVYEDGQVGDNDINTELMKYSSEISSAVGYRT